MLQTIKRACVLAAVPAALALAVTTPAGADDLGARAVIGTSYEEQDFGGRSGVLEAGAPPCTDMPGVATARSATNNVNSGYTIRFYADLNCEAEVAKLSPGQSEKGGMTVMGHAGAVAYTVTPA